MKKNLALFFTLMLCMSLNAQVMKIYKGNTLVSTYTSAEADKVVFEPTTPVQSLALNPPSVILHQGTSIAVAVTFMPEDATPPALSWTSANPAVATVRDGVVTGIASGETTITCEALDGSSAKATCTVTVIDQGMKACVGFYETVPGFSVKDLKMYFGEHVDHVDDNICLLGESYTWNFGKLSNFAPAEYSEAGDSFVARSASCPTMTDYIIISPDTQFGELFLAISFTLIACDGSGEVIQVKGARATIPQGVVTYRSGTNCKILFKIHDTTTPMPSTINDMYKISVEVVYEPIDSGHQAR